MKTDPTTDTIQVADGGSAMQNFVKTVKRGAMVAAIGAVGVAGALGQIAGVSAAPPSVENAERIAMYSKPAVVRVLSGCAGEFYWPRLQKSYSDEYVGTGSGFFIHSTGYIATNAHVTELAKEPAKCEEALLDTFVSAVASDYGIDTSRITREQYEQLAQTVKQGGRLTSYEHMNYAIIANGSYFPYEIKSYGAPVGDGKDVSVIKIEVRNAPVIKVADSETTRLQEHVTVIGYPAAADTRQNGLLHKRSSLEASITDGRISARKNTADSAPVLQISAPTTHGNSGGPVLNDNGEVIGLLTFRGDTVRGQEVQGFNFVVASNTLMEFVRQSGTTNEQGPADKVYREGLDLFWQGQFRMAIAKFEEVRRLFPHHSETDRLVREAQENITAGKEPGPAAATGRKDADAPVKLTGKNQPASATTGSTAGAPATDASSEESGLGAINSTPRGGPAFGIGGNPLGMELTSGALALVAAAVGVAVMRRRNLAPAFAGEGQGNRRCDSCGAARRGNSAFCTLCGVRSAKA